MEFECSRCGAQVSADTHQWRCSCGSPFVLNFSYEFPDQQELQKRPSTIWRYREALPIEDDRHIVSFQEGYSPLVPDRVNGLDLWWKLEYVAPTGSVKDRGTSVLISRIKEMGIERIVEDSSGNAGASVAAYCARAGISARIFVPQSTSANKKRQIKIYGAELAEVPGDREQTAEAAHRAAENTYYASQIWNPYFIEGAKTCGFEIVEQLGWEAPDYVMAPMGVGTIILALVQGFRELRDQGVISHLPRIVGVQAENCCPFYDGWKSGRKREAYTSTIAEGIAHTDSPRFEEILGVIRESQGSVVTVSEEKIREGMAALSRRGFFVEPTSAVVLPALSKLCQEADLADRKIVVLLTGVGLKYTPPS